MTYTKLLLISILLFANHYLKAQDCNCNTDDYKKWNQGNIVFSSGQINLLESSKIIIKDEVKINNENMLAVNSRVNKYHNGYYFYYNAYFHYKIVLPKEIEIKLTNNKGGHILLESTKSISEQSEYYNFISQKDISFKNFINTGLITKIEFIDSNKNNKVLANYFLSFNESIELTKLFCCAIKLKKEIIGQID